MHKQSMTCSFIALVGFACTACGGAADDPLGSESQGAGASSSTEVKFTELFDPANVLGQGFAGEAIDPGEVTCPGHTPTGAQPPLSPCPEGSRISIRHARIVVAVDVPGDGGTTRGSLTFDINANWDANGAGPLWGTWSSNVPSGTLEGVMEGTLHGMRTPIAGGCAGTTLPCFAEHVEGVGKGTMGAVAGAHFHVAADLVDFGLSGIAFYGNDTAEIFWP